MANNTTVSAYSEREADSSSWTAMPICYLVIMIIATISNGVVLYVFARHPHLRTAFNVYIINLSMANLIETFMMMPLNIATYLRSHWWLGSTACSVFIYGLSLQAVAINSHLLITINRMWAVSAPVSYRTYHRKKVSICLCIFIWLYVHVVHTPGYVIDAVYYRPPVEIGCFVNGMMQYGWFHAMQFCLFKIPVLAIICCYPYVAYKSLKARTFRSVHPTTVSAMTGSDTRAVKGPTSGHHDGMGLTADVAQDMLVVLHNRRAESSRRRGAFLLLSVMTLSMLVFWTPSAVYYTVVSFGHVNWPAVEQAANIMCLLETIADPICFTLALKEVREAVKGLLLPWKSS
ncbi:hypothetical protein RvY_16074 [Ramazzottius varieornatus]|uniref:G-protein coupled receptors family 1 profile domain-containing protein n=1 Tax=Ramazzottius varieornatus TaxID=947166 RepID=A0A1D1VX59_RAMVA|nr:hypothetical protein RvY_16074 [Ramazzottius varieornatus]